MELFASASLLALLAGVLLAMATRADVQRHLDANRLTYQLTFPAEMTDKGVYSFIRAIGNNLKHNPKFAVPTLVFETRSSSTGITHYMRVPKDAATYIIGQLQNTLPGIDVREIIADNDNARVNNTRLPSPQGDGFQFGATLHLANFTEEIPIANTVDYAYRVLSSMQEASQEHDAVCVQWIIAHSDNQKQPPSDKPVNSKRQTLLSSVFSPKHAGRDEVKSRRTKQIDQNYIATARVAARGATVQRAEQLVRQVLRAYMSEGGYAHFVAKGARPQEISRDIRLATTPFQMTAQLNVSELSAVIGWPMDNRYLSGLDRGTTRHMPASESIPRNGRVLGVSTMPGIDRQIAMDYRAAVMHTFVAGRTGTGKTTLMVNTIRQDMERGAGIILIERDGNFFRKALEQVPPERVKDVICIDLSRNDRPVGLNLLRLNKPELVAGQFAALLDALYPDNKTIYSSQLVRHGIPVLANLPRATVVDLLTLANPRNPAEKAWAKAAIEASGDKIYQDYWQDWYRDEKQIPIKSVSLTNRMLDLVTPEPIRYLINQETSSFEPADVIRGNKLLFVNLAGVSEQAASLIGTMIVTAIWTAAKQVRPDKPNFMYLDEFQQFSHLSSDFEDMLAEARKHNLGLTIATQYIERLSRDMQYAVMSNTATKVIFQSSSDSASIYSRDFGHVGVRADSFVNLKAYDALARINTRAGLSEPITLHTLPEPEGYGFGNRILDISAAQYGRDIEAIKRDDSTRRIAIRTHQPATPPKDIGRSTYDV